jgi:hypothetical protein
VDPPAHSPEGNGEWRGARLLLYSCRGSFSSSVSSSRASSGDGGDSRLSSAWTKLLLPVFLAFLIVEFTGEGRVSAWHRADLDLDSARCSFVLACSSRVLLLAGCSVVCK